MGKRARLPDYSISQVDDALMTNADIARVLRDILTKSNDEAARVRAGIALDKLHQATQALVRAKNPNAR